MMQIGDGLPAISPGFAGYLFGDEFVQAADARRMERFKQYAPAPHVEARGLMRPVATGLREVPARMAMARLPIPPVEDQVAFPQHVEAPLEHPWQEALLGGPTLPPGGLGVRLSNKIVIAGVVVGLVAAVAGGYALGRRSARRR